MVKKDNLIVGVDIGTTKICTIIGEVDSQGEIDIIGLGLSPSRGLRKGVVIDLESTVEAIKKSVHEAEIMAGIPIESAYVGIAGGHIKGISSRGVIAVSGKNREITQTDIDRVIDAAKAVALPMDREVIHVLPQEYIIDNQDRIKQPLGLSGVRLEVDVHIITGAVASAQNIIKSVNRAGLEVKDIILEQLASSEATMVSDEKELGVAVVDIGGGTTDLAIFVNGSIRHAAVISLGGDNFTYDIAVGLRTPNREAEEIKRKHGCVLTTLLDDKETVEVPTVGGRKPRVVSRQVLCEIMEPRAEEIFGLVDREIKNSGYGNLIPAGVLITGGSSLMKGMVEIGEQIFDLPVRLGIPSGFGGLSEIVKSPEYATGTGLLLYGWRYGQKDPHFMSKNDSRLFQNILKRMKDWMKDFF
ncbi:MAG: cell division protein FtsA [Deltaproteobacteria bacterium]|nr:cell division protein FtsA [Deltaproteobacteria bacterium]